MQTSYRLDDVSSDTLLVNLKRLVGGSNELTAHLLAHLAEGEARGIYREVACSSLYTYCVYELRFSEDEAQRRCRAARVARQFPVIFEMLADASIHLTGILLLASHLTGDNHIELLARARYRTTTANGRHIPAAVKRAVWARDGGRCTYADVRGQRCRETSLLEFHHREPYAKGGAASLDNVTVHCRAHNQLAAEQDFGRDVMESKKRGEPTERTHSKCPIRLSDVWTGAEAIEGYRTGCSAHFDQKSKVGSLPHLASLGGRKRNTAAHGRPAPARNKVSCTAQHHNALALSGRVAAPNTLP